MNEKPRKYVGIFVGLGLMFIWVTAYFPWIDFWQADNLFAKLIGITGTLLVSLSGIAISFYTNDVEMRLRQVSERNALNESEAMLWKEQAQLAIELLEKERGSRRATSN